MKRRVIRQGPASYMISLPKNWIKQKEIKKGQELEVTVEGESILITADNLEILKESKVILFDETNLEEIYRLYSEGFSEINILFKTEKDYKVIKKVIDNLVGADILERGKKDAQILFSNHKFNIDNNKSIINILSLLKWQIQSLQKELQNKNLRNIEEIEDISYEVSSKISLFLRQIFFSQRIGSNYLLCKTGFESLKNIQKGILIYYKNRGKKNYSNVSIDELKRIGEIFGEIITSFSNKNYFNEDFSRIILKINDEVSKKNNSEPLLYFLIGTILMNIESFCKSFKSLSNIWKDSFNA
ncbi:MAG: AbrB/MazE/SpoVT family DNA-binding domain-containing protein [Candidatus Pacearchaeota archaeon]